MSESSGHSGHSGHGGDSGFRGNPSHGRRGFGSRVFGWIATPGAGVFLLGATLAFAVLGASDRIGRALLTMKQDNVIRVKGVAEIGVTSDRATWKGTVEARASTLPDAYAELERSMDALKGFVESKGISPAEISVFSVDVTKVMKRDAEGNSTNEIEYYTLRQQLGLNTAQVEVARTLANEVTALIQRGFMVESWSPDFTVSTIEEVKLELLEQATSNAHERAKTIARGSGGRPGRLVSASQGVFQIVALDSTDTSDWRGSYDTRTIEKTARCVVTLEYAID